LANGQAASTECSTPRITKVYALSAWPSGQSFFLLLRNSLPASDDPFAGFFLMSGSPPAQSSGDFKMNPFALCEAKDRFEAILTQ